MIYNIHNIYFTGYPLIHLPQEYNRIYVITLFNFSLFLTTPVIFLTVTTISGWYCFVVCLASFKRILSVPDARLQPSFCSLLIWDDPHNIRVIRISLLLQEPLWLLEVDSLHDAHNAIITRTQMYLTHFQLYFLV